MRVLPNVFMVLGAVSVAFAMLLSMVNIPVSADPPENPPGNQNDNMHCPGGWVYKDELNKTEGKLPEGLVITINGASVTFNRSVDFCVKASNSNSGKITGDSYTVTFENNGGQTPDISYVVVYEETLPTPPAPIVSLSKSANPSTLEGGGTFTFTLTIESDQNVSITSLTDSWWGDKGTCSSLTSLEAGVSKSCSYSITEYEIGTHTNNASVTVNNNNGGASAYASASITVTENPIVIPPPTVVLEKSVDPVTRPEPGGEFIFTLTIKNTSFNPVTIDELTDTYALSDKCEALVKTQIPAGGSATCDYPVTETEEGVYKNGATVTVSNGGGSASDDAEATFNVTKADEPNPDPDQLSVTLDKSVFPSTLPKPGGVFTFTLLITNTSDETEEIIELEDDYPLSDECNDLIGTEIGPDDFVSCTYTVTKSEVGKYDNEASVTVSEVESTSILTSMTKSSTTRTATAKDDATFSVTGGETTETPDGPDPTETPDPSETPDPEKTPDPTNEPNPEKTPDPTSAPDQPAPEATLSQPVQQSNPTVLIPVTGVEFGAPMRKTSSVLFNTGLGLLGIGLVLQSIRKKIK